MKRYPFRANGSEFADSNVAAIIIFHQCLSLIAVSKLSTQDRTKILARPFDKTYQKTAYRFGSSVCFMLD